MIWCVAMVALLSMGMYEFNAFSNSDTEMMQEMTTTIPESLQVVFGMNGADLSTASGYYSILYFYFLLMGAIYAGMLGAKVITKEEMDKTSEFLFVKPISRSRILTNKISAGIVCLAVFNLVLLLSTSLFFYVLESSVPIEELISLNISFLIFQLIFFTLGMFIPSIGKSMKGAGAKIAIIIFICYMFNVVWQLNENLEFIKYLTPFAYFPINEIIEGNSFDIAYVIISIAIIFICTAYTYIKFNKKDLT